MYVWDPGGWLLHFAEPHSAENKAFFNDAPWLSKVGEEREGIRAGSGEEQRGAGDA